MRISDWSSDVCSSDLTSAITQYLKEEPIDSISTTSPVIETHPFRYRVGLRTNNSSPIMNLGLVIIKRLGVSHHGIQLTQSIRIKLARSSQLGATSFPLGGFLFLTNLGNAHDIPNRFDHLVNVMIRDKLDEFLVLLELLHVRQKDLRRTRLNSSH